MKKIIDVLQEVMEGGFEQAGYDKKFGFVTVSNRPDLCQYQCNGAMAAAKQYKMAPFQIAEKVVEAVKENDIFENIDGKTGIYQHNRKRKTACGFWKSHDDRGKIWYSGAGKRAHGSH